MASRNEEEIEEIKQEIVKLNQQIRKDNQNTQLRFSRVQLYMSAFNLDDELSWRADAFWEKSESKVIRDLNYIEKKGVSPEKQEAFYEICTRYYFLYNFNDQKAYEFALKYYNVTQNKADALYYLIRAGFEDDDPACLEQALAYNSEYLTLPNIDYDLAIAERASILTVTGDYTKALQVIDDAIESHPENKELLGRKFTFLNERLYSDIKNEQYRKDFFEYGINFITACPDEHIFDYYFNCHFAVCEELQLPLNELFYELKELEKIYGDKSCYFYQLAQYYEKNQDFQRAIDCYEKANERADNQYYATDIYRLYQMQGDRTRATEAYKKLKLKDWQKWNLAENVIFDLHGYPHDFELGFRLANEYREEHPDDECAIRLLALCYEDGLGVEKNTRKAAELYQSGLHAGGNCGCCMIGYVLCKLYGNGTDKNVYEAKRAFLEREKKATQRYVPETFARIALESPDNYFNRKKAIRKLIEKEKDDSEGAFCADLYLLLYKLSKTTQKKREYREKFIAKSLTDSMLNKVENARFLEENNLDLPLFVPDI